MKDTRNKQEIIMITAAGVLPVIWLALKIAPYWHDGMLEVISRSDEVFASPFDIEPTEDSLQAVLLCLLIYAFGIGIWLSMRENYRRGEADKAKDTIELSLDMLPSFETENQDSDYLILCEDEIEKEYLQEGGEQS